MGDEMMLTIVDANGARHERVHCELAAAAVAALAADPESLADLDAAIERYARRDGTRGFFEGWSPGVCDEPWDEGVCVIDLAARLAAWESTWRPVPELHGKVSYHDPNSPGDIQLRYRLSDDWLITGIEGWNSRAAQRRAERLARPLLDFRPVLYDKVVGYLVQECLAARAEWTDTSIAAIHAAWLMTPRDDLGGRTPRELLLERREAIAWDLENQLLNWWKLGAPRGLPLESAAYRRGGCGTHEVVLYYELVRHLLEAARQWLFNDAGQPVAEGADAAGLAARLEEARREWLEAPRLEGLTPPEVIELERRRIPRGPSGAHLVLDDDSPLGRMMAEDSDPCCVYLDGSDMDDDFAFSFHRSRDEWEAERLEMEEFDRGWQAMLAARKAAKSQNAASETGQPGFSADYAPASLLELALLRIAADLSELGSSLQRLRGGQGWGQSLNCHFADLREAVRNADGALQDPAVEEFRDELAGAAAAYPALGEQCAELDRHVRQLDEAIVLRMGGEDLPF